MGIMVSREDGKYVIWPAYFDINLTRSEGRRVPKDLAVDNPSLDAIYKIAKEMNLNPEIEKDARYPFRPWRKEGRILVDMVEKKTKIVLDIARKLKSRQR